MSSENKIYKHGFLIPDDLFGKNVRLSFKSLYPLVEMVKGKEGHPSVGWFDVLNLDYHEALIANTVIGGERFLIFKTRFHRQNGRNIYAKMEWEQKRWIFAQFLILT